MPDTKASGLTVVYMTLMSIPSLRVFISFMFSTYNLDKKQRQLFLDFCYRDAEMPLEPVVWVQFVRLTGRVFVTAPAALFERQPYEKAGSQPCLSQ